MFVTFFAKKVMCTSSNIYFNNNCFIRLQLKKKSHSTNQSLKRSWIDTFNGSSFLMKTVLKEILRKQLLLRC